MKSNCELNNFVLSTLGDIEIIGYQWDLENPDKVVCIIHGIGEHAGRYDEIAKRLNEENIAVFSFDLRGHGLSGGVRGHCASRHEVFLDIEELLAYSSLKHPHCKTILLGHSMGGNIVLDFRNRAAFNGDLDGYIVMSPWIKLVKKISSIEYLGIKLLSKLMPTHKLNAKIKKSDLGNLEVLKDYEKDELLHSFITMQSAVEGFDIGNALFDDTHIKSGTGREKPMLLMHGDKDRICDVDGSRKIYENQKETCEYVEWKDMLHELHNGNEQSKGKEVVDKIISWVKEI